LFYSFLDKQFFYSAPPDYEAATSHTVEVTVSDGTFSIVVHVNIQITDVNDGGPTFASATYTATAAENTAVGTSLVTVAATDPDLSTSTYGKLTFSITAGNTGNVFVIDPNTGKVSIAGVLNYETTTSYTLTLQVSEQTGGNTDTASLTITVTDVNDNTPSCTSAMTFSYTMAETGTVNDVIYSMTCTDADASDTLTYTLSSGSSTYFQISGTDLTVIYKQKQHSITFF